MRLETLGIDTLSRTMPPFRQLWLCGGKPSMRRRLDSARAKERVKYGNIPLASKVV